MVKTYTLRIHEGSLSKFGFLVFLNFGDYDNFEIQFIDKYTEKSLTILNLMLKLGMVQIGEKEKIPFKTTAGYVIAINKIHLRKKGIHR